MDLKDPVLIFLHGFLGEAHDWAPVIAALPPNLRARSHAVDYVKLPELSPQAVSLSEWGHAFAGWARKTYPGQSVWLIGYSQGGRLALHALREAPDLIHRGFLVSANLGFPTAALEDRQQRKRSDEVWAQRFEGEAWDEVISAWNAQPVFQGGRQEPDRPAEAGSGARAAASLRRWGLGQQDDFRDWCRSQSDRLVWIVGERDQKYRELLSEIEPQVSVEVIPESGHRILFDQPEALAASLGRRLEAQLKH